MTKIFGREPAVLAALVEALLALLISFNALTGLGIKGQHELMLTMAVVNGALGLYVAYVTRDTLLGAAVALVKALIAFGAIYGLTLTTEQTGTLIAFLTVAVGLFQRTQTGPALAPSLSPAAHSTRGVITPMRTFGTSPGINLYVDVDSSNLVDHGRQVQAALDTYRRATADPGE